MSVAPPPVPPPVRPSVTTPPVRPDPYLGPDNLLVSPSAARWDAMSEMEREAYLIASLRAVRASLWEGSAEGDPYLGPDNLLVSPSAARWDAMSEMEREAYLLASLQAMATPLSAMSEGAPHSRAKSRLWRLVGDQMRARGRSVYLALELPVHYPDERVFSPDLLAVCDVPDPGDKDHRLAWNVRLEGRGPDLALEVFYHGDPQKDFIRNVLRYARLGIREYFIYHRKDHLLIAYHLPDPASRSYTMRAPDDEGFLRSDVLGLDLGLRDGRLVLREDGEDLPDSDEVMARTRDRLGALEQRLTDREDALSVAESALRAEREARAAAEEALAAERAARQALEAELARLRRG